MKLLEAIARVAKNDPSIKLNTYGEFGETDRDHITAAKRFLFGDGYTKDNEISEEATMLISRLQLTGDDFEYIGRGGNGTAYGNNEIVFRLDSVKEERTMYIPVAEVPEGLSATVINSGECNGIGYRLSERLEVVEATLFDVIPFLFQAKTQGVVYEEIDRNSFGFSQDGKFKALDPKHFQILGEPPSNFELSLHTAIKSFATRKLLLPVITFDDDNTYVVLAPQNADSMRDRLYSALRLIGIDTNRIENIKDPPVLSIPETKIRLHDSSEETDLADLIKNVLKEPPEITGSRRSSPAR